MLQEMLKYALQVARRMSRDQETESLAGVAAWRAWTTYRPELGDWRPYVSKFVRLSIQYYWRTRKPVLLEAPELIPAKEDSEQLDIPMEDWQLLVESYIDRWPMDVIARRHGVTVYRIKKQLTGALSRLKGCICDQ
jgi:hypothetical protein